MICCCSLWIIFRYKTSRLLEKVQNIGKTHFWEYLLLSFRSLKTFFCKVNMHENTNYWNLWLFGSVHFLVYFLDIMYRKKLLQSKIYLFMHVSNAKKFFKTVILSSYLRTFFWPKFYLMMKFSTTVIFISKLFDCIHMFILAWSN